MIVNQLKTDLQRALKRLDFALPEVELSIPDNSTHGDYTTNVALQLSKPADKGSYQSPREIASKILGTLGHPDYLEMVNIAGPGFINFFIKDEVLIKQLLIDKQRKTKGLKIESKKYLIEYGHPNFLKEIHIGHQRSFILGESLSRILESLGHQVFRANYQGDIGLHIAKAIFGIQKLGLPKEDLDLEAKAKFLGKSYALGDSAYKQNPTDKERIDYVNIALYKKDPEFREIYKLTRQWSMEYFLPRYELLGEKYSI